MPKKNMALDYALTRYHRIGSPDDPARVERDRPLECALCHADKTVASLVGDDGAWWKQKLRPRARSRTSTARSTRAPLVATLTRGKPHEQAVALAVLGEARRTEAPPASRASSRTRSRSCATTRSGRSTRWRTRPCAVDLDPTTPEIVAAVRACVPAAFPEPVPAALPAKPRTRTDDTDED